VLGEQQLHEIRDTFAIGRPDQYVTVPLGIDMHGLNGDSDKGPALREAWGIGARETVVGIVGRLAAIKNHDLFLRVAARSSNGTRFVVYGDGGERDQLVHRAAELKIEDRVVFAGTRDADEIYASLDVAALTSLNEGTPLAIIEAMAAGKPVVSTAVGGVVDLLGAVEQRIETNGSFFEIRERGLTAPSDDAAGFSSALAHLLHDEILRRRLVERGKVYVNRTHTKQRLIDDIVSLYRGLDTRH